MSVTAVSVALCTHNGGRFVEHQIASIGAQTVPVLEIVLGDDASTDDTLIRARAAAAEAGIPLTVLESSQPLGVTANFERTILACRAELVALADQDDVWHPNRVAEALVAFDAAPTTLLVHADADLVDETESPLGIRLFEALEIGERELGAIREGDAFAAFLRRNLVTGATTMMRRSLAEIAAPFPRSWVHDEWLAIVAAALDGVGVIDAPLIGYRQHGGNQIGARKLGLAGKLGRMVEPGAARNARLLQRATDLVERLGQLPGVRPSRLDDVAQKLEHEQARSGLPTSRLRRLRPVLDELRTGRYREFGRGGADAVRDLIQPLETHG